MKNVLLISALFFSILSNAQQVTFQGKLFENGTPANGLRTFDFFIGNPINWTESQSVQVNNGLYAVVLGSTAGHALPLNLFATSNSRNLIVKVNGNIIDTVTVYAPFERDYTVPDNIKDGISWSEVLGKPTVDTSFTNEIQTLSVSNDTLRISQGNAVKLPGGGGLGNQNVTIYGNLTVKDTTADVIISQPNYTLTGNSNKCWQSFLAKANGKLRQLQLQLGVIGGANYVGVNIYKGDSTGTQSIGFTTVSGLNNITQSRILDLSNLSPSVSIKSGSVYTFEIIAPPSNTLDVKYNSFDPYPFGFSNFGRLTDLSFDISIDNSVPTCFTFNNNCYIGIGNDSPTSQLTVGGRIEDQTGFVMPVGSIIPFAGSVVPKGWLLCNGDSKDRNQYADLFYAIGTSWGSSDNYSFNLPDLRGMFLRGVDPIGNVDPDNSSSVNNGDDRKRYALNANGNTGNLVGSYQLDIYQNHNHQPTPGGNFLLDGSASVGAAAVFVAGGSGVIKVTSTTNSKGGNETRPKNAYVNYIIKY